MSSATNRGGARVAFEPIEGWPGYLIGAHGHVYSEKCGRILAEGCDRDGYPTVQLTQNGRSTALRVHVLVCSAFRGPRPPRHQVRHLNGVRSDNRLANLKWGTAKENAADRVRHGNSCRGELNGGGGKLKLRQAREIKRRARAGENMSALAREFGVTPGMVWFIKAGRQWRHA